IHDVSTGFFSEILAKQLGYFIGKFLEYDGTDLGKGSQNFLRIRVQLDVRRPLKRKKQAKMALGVEITVMGWDLSLRAQYRIALSLSNIWLREGVEGEKGEILIEGDVTITLRSFSKRHIDVVIEDPEDGNKWRYTSSYGTPYAQDRDESWLF
ncbi:hypothetical protein Goarm_020560, partial [Gossypium armourianum]|nr:hypothetical protein [Gossypium armourianum]